jgi:hypothetical protein
LALLRRFFELLNTSVAVAIVLVFFLVLDGFLLYRHQLRLVEPLVEPSATTALPATSESADTPASSALSTTEEPLTTEETTTESSEPNIQQNATTTTTAAEKAGAIFPTEKTGVLRVGVSVVNAPTWLEIEVDGQNALAKARDPGFSRKFNAEREVTISAAHGSSVEVEVDGQDVGYLGTSDAPATRTFTR